jgi:hypothetical protein
VTNSKDPSILLHEIRHLIAEEVGDREPLAVMASQGWAAWFYRHIIRHDKLVKAVDKLDKHMSKSEESS